MKKNLRPFDPQSELVAPRHLHLVAGISSTTAWRLRKLGRFPLPIRLTATRCAYRMADLRAWVAAREFETTAVSK
jgi:predicted DNA-binding transcriptional regulator AlpA